MSAGRPALILGALLLVTGAQVHGSDVPTKLCPAFPAPQKTKLESVAQEMDFNGVPMAIRSFESEQPPETILAYYRELWAATKTTPGPVEYPLGEWQVIATSRNPCFYTVQVKAYGNNGAQGFLGLSAPPPDRAPVKEDVPLLPGSQIVNDIAHNDAGKTARTVLVKNGFTPAANADFYRQNLTGQGWKVLTHHRVEKPDSNGEVVIFKDGVREVSVTAMRQGDGSNVLLNYVDQP